MNTHTPGDWIVSADIRGTHLTVDRISDGLRSVVCRLNASDLCDEHGGTIDANARLLASAPALLAALRRVLEIVESGEDLSNKAFFGTEQNQLRAAIAQAEGNA